MQHVRFYECDACGKVTSEGERRGGIRGGGEGTFCAECCGERSDTFDVRAYKTEQDYDRCRPTTVIDGITGCDNANQEARKWLADHAVVKVQSSDRETVDVLRQSDTSQPGRAVEARQLAYTKTKYSAFLDSGVIQLRPHWTGLADGDEVRTLLQEIASYYNSHESLIAALAGLMSRFEQTGEAWMSDPAWIAANDALAKAKGRE